jgi:multiple sugar transport system substrate-binding protein
MFEAKGIDPPTTYDELLAAAAALTEDTDGDGVIDIYGVAIPYSAVAWYTSAVYDTNCAAYTGSDWWDEDLKLILDDPDIFARNVDFMDYYADLAQYSPPGAAEWDWSGGRIAFRTETCAMLWYASRALVEIYHNEPDLIDKVAIMNPQPAGPAEYGGARSAWLDPDGVVLFSEAYGAPGPNAVKAFAEYLLTGRDGEIALMHTGSVPMHMVPPTMDMATSDVYMALPEVVAFADQYAITLEFLDSRYISNPMLNAGMEVIDGEIHLQGTTNPIRGHIIGKRLTEQAIQKRIIGGETSEAALNWLIGEIETTMTELGYTP